MNDAIGPLCSPSLSVARSLRSLANRHVVITGGSSGIGLACAEEFAKQGAHVSLYGRDSVKLERARSQIIQEATKKAPFVTVSTKVVDVSDRGAVRAALAQSEELRPVDVLVCNAGVVRPAYAEDQTEEEVEEQVRTNFLGTVYAAQAVLPRMKARSDSEGAASAIVIMCSLSGLSYWYGAAVYTATKYAQRGYAETLRVELLPYNIQVSVICPGFTQTPFLDDVDRCNPKLSAEMKVATLYERRHSEDPKAISKKTVEAVKHSHFLVTTSDSPLALVQAALARGLFPPESLLGWILEAILVSPIRFLSKLISVGLSHDIRQAYRRNPDK